MNAEQSRLEAARTGQAPWKKWGPYLSERQWGTVREDYSNSGNAWDYFSHDQSRSRAYRWGEDGIAGFSDDRQSLCFAVTFWNGRDPILKERLFGLTNSEGNHGEDVKEYYFYLDSTPTHSYMRYRYKYPHQAYPYSQLVDTNRARGRHDQEFELLDTGIFRDNRYFDVDVEFAKSAPEDVLVKITVRNRGPEAADIHVLPTLWFRNTWSWGDAVTRPTLEFETPASASASDGSGPPQAASVAVASPKLGRFVFECERTDDLLFTENETNCRRIFGTDNPSPYVKDAFHEALIHGRAEAVNPERRGTKCAALYRRTVAAGGEEVIRVRLRPRPEGASLPVAFGPEFDGLVDARRSEADEFYGTVIPANLSDDQALVMRQSLAGMLWGKQVYIYDVNRWLDERGTGEGCAAHPGSRNDGWHHMYNADVISMPDKWEYPWYAAWDLAFHVVTLSLVDTDFAKEQLNLMLLERYLHPNGQIPAYEWNFGDVNPPVHAWATMFTYRLEQGHRGQGDVRWLEHAFQKLLLNFTWWVNRKDRTGRNVFEGGFLGLDNIGVFDRSAPLPTGGCLEQADGTAWMALFCQNMLDIAGELSRHDPVYSEMALKFLQHFLWISSAMLEGTDEGHGMWDEEDGFFYDVLRLPDGTSHRLKVRSIVGLLPLCAVCVYDGSLRDVSAEAAERFDAFLRNRPELVAEIHDLRTTGVAGRKMTSILNEARLRRVLAHLLDEGEFLGEFGIRSLSRYHDQHPYVLPVGGAEYRVNYLPAESDSGMFGGNSNWRGPIWMPMNALIVRGLLLYYQYYGDSFQVEFPTGSGRMMNLFEVAREITGRLERIFVRDAHGRRPVFGGTETFQNDPHWKDCILFYEYFHGDNGAGLGASHQTGWTAIVSRLMRIFATISAEDFLKEGRQIFSRNASSPPEVSPPAAASPPPETASPPPAPSMATPTTVLR
ncbi:MGH1-like glycoside hydrolase domain-containing protein [Planctomyces sp. SH-PL14]|uniref:MGH1-like glycoside hydrolase domain-containing protein n=1 Tax=Planctomyces sp. SH-PL14 TaxID=1632864 RepID=UPI00078C7AEA|nr:glucosidase [Planctomyces sp. SH-PL14]AMV20808.1 Mannosyl oligosaccharide glucosidase [Planctomyces sp. SH-PL14]